MTRRNSGFTLMEIVVVIGVMAILALTMVPNLTAYIQKADDSKNSANIQSVHRAAETAIQINPLVSVKDISWLTESTRVKRSDLIKDIAELANLEIEDIDIVANAATAHSNGVGKFFISPDITKTKILVRYNSDRSNYLYNGTESENIDLGGLAGNLYDHSKLTPGFLADNLGRISPDTTRQEGTSAFIKIDPMFKIVITLKFKPTPDYKWFAYVLYDKDKKPIVTRNNNHLSGTEGSRETYIREVIVPPGVEYIRVSARYLLSDEVKLDVSQRPS